MMFKPLLLLFLALFFSAGIALGQGDNSRILHGDIQFNDSTTQTTAATAPAIGGAITGGTTCSVLFVGAGPVLAQDNTAFCWDATNHRLGIGTTTPASPLSVAGIIQSTTGGFKFPDNTTQTTAAANTPPAGAVGAVQFNNGGSFGGDQSNFYWDRTFNRLGIDNSHPDVPLDVKGRVVFDAVGETPATATTLSSSITNSDATIPAVDTTDYPKHGTLLIDNEMITYTGVGPSLFTGCGRGAYGTTAASHSSGATVNVYLLLAAEGTTRTLAALGNGKVGIGTGAPANPLSVAGIIQSTTGGFKFPDNTTQTTAAGGAAIGDTVGGGTTCSVLFVGAGPVLAQDNSAFCWDATNHRLGIGTTTPDQALTLAAGSSIHFEAPPAEAALIFGDTNSTIGKQMSGTAIEYRGASHQFYIDSAATRAVEVVASGDIGGIHVYHDSGHYTAYTTNSIIGPTDNVDAVDATLTIRAGTNTFADRSGGDLVLESGDRAGAGTKGSVIFGNYTTEAMRIDPTGKLGIGTTAPAAELDVAGKVTITGVGNSHQLFFGTADDSIDPSILPNAPYGSIYNDGCAPETPPAHCAGDFNIVAGYSNTPPSAPNGNGDYLTLNAGRPTDDTLGNGGFGGRIQMYYWLFNPGDLPIRSIGAELGEQGIFKIGGGAFDTDAGYGLLEVNGDIEISNTASGKVFYSDVPAGTTRTRSLDLKNGVWNAPGGGQAVADSTSTHELGQFTINKAGQIAYFTSTRTQSDFGEGLDATAVYTEKVAGGQPTDNANGAPLLVVGGATTKDSTVAVGNGGDLTLAGGKPTDDENGNGGTSGSILFRTWAVPGGGDPTLTTRMTLSNTALSLTLPLVSSNGSIDISSGGSPSIKLGAGKVFGVNAAQDYLDVFNAQWATPGGGHQFVDSTGGASWVGPVAAGAAGTVLTNDGAGNTSWVAPSGGTPTIYTNTVNTSATCTATCGAGHATGGGCSNSSANSLMDSHPSSTTVWSCTWPNALTNCTAYVICI